MTPRTTETTTTAVTPDLCTASASTYARYGVTSVIDHAAIIRTRRH
ncbi:hypothetical protein ABGB18_31270 [Nonomuraea sp. B12E4]